MLVKLQRNFERYYTFKIGTIYKELSLTQLRTYHISFVFKLANAHIDSPTLLGKFKFAVPSYDLRVQPVFKIPYHHTQYGGADPLVRMMEIINDY